MPTFADVCAFENLYEAHRLSRRGKRDRREVIEFELDLGSNLARLSAELAGGSYAPGPYARFVVEDPKRRVVHALRYRDRVVQHSLCDNVVAPVMEPRLVYDNAACRVGKGTGFALARLEGFLREHWRRHGCDGWFLKCDVRHFFSSIRHDRLLAMLGRCPFDGATPRLLRVFVEGYHEAPGRGLPLGNQTSQWFALWYLDPLDRLVKERLRVRGYVRYMDDCVLVHPDRGFLDATLASMCECTAALGLEFNGKTQIAPLRNGIDFLGWHLYLTPGGRVVRRLRASAKRRVCKRAAALAFECDPARKVAVMQSLRAYLEGGGARGLAHALLSENQRCFTVTRETD